MKLNNDNLIIETTGEHTPTVTDDIYSVTYSKHEKKILFGVEKLFIWFKILTPGSFLDVEIYKAYNYSKKLSVKSLLIRDIERVLGRKLLRKEKPSISIFKNKILRVKTRTVVKDCRQKELADFHKYSVIAEIIETEVGNNA